MREPHVAREPATGPRIGGHSRCVTGTCGPQSPQGRSCPRQRRRARARSEAASRRHRATNRLARIPRPRSCRYERHCVPQRTVGFPLRGLHRVAPVAQLRRRPRPQRRRLRAAARRAAPRPQPRGSPRGLGCRYPARASRNQPLRPKPARPLPRSPATAQRAERGGSTRNRHRTRLGGRELFCIRRHRKRHVPLLFSPQRSMRRKRGGKAVLYTKGR